MKAELYVVGRLCVYFPSYAKFKRCNKIARVDSQIHSGYFKLITLILLGLLI